MFDPENKRIGFAKSIHNEYEAPYLALMSEELEVEPRRATCWQAFFITMIPVFIWMIASKVYFTKKAKEVGAKIDGDYIKA